MQPYPPYSSKTVQGKPLYWWARQNRLGEIMLPTHEINVHDITLRSIEHITLNDLRSMIFERINKVQGNFRQDEILTSWDSFFQPENQKTSQPEHLTLHCTITCTSGTYIRGIANEIGEKLGCGALALTIKRTRIGTYTLDNTLPLPPYSLN